MKIESDAELLKTIHEGKPNMPAWKARLSKKDTRDVLAYIRNLIEEK
jgi:mono/diheme cytochrome c family protein